MAKITGIIAEFNPFHNGHAALARRAGELGGDAVVAVMSGNFVQRGEPAVTDKRVRARAALLCGVDLVLELPLPFTAAPAQRFARGGAELLAATGCVDTLLFGSECGDAGLLRALSDAVDAPSLQPVIREYLSSGVTYAKARERAVAGLLGREAASALASPNNALAVEYLRAAGHLRWSPRIHTMRRVGADHDSSRPAGAFASASYLRQNAGDWELLRRYAPEPAVPVYQAAAGAGLYPADPNRLETAMLAHLRRLGPEDLAALPDLSEGLENRLYAAIRHAGSLSALEAALKTKRYTMARIRRMVLAAFLGLTREDCAHPVPYLRVLGFNPRGREILSEMKRSATLPLGQSLARLRARGGTCARFAQLEARATDLYALALPVPPACGYEYSASAVFLKENGKSPGIVSELENMQMF